jgi:hypothetical protein
MIKIKYLAAVAALALVLSLAWLIRVLVGTEGSSAPAGTTYAQGPKLVLDEEYYDFGRVPFERWVQRVFRFRNAGNETLVVDVPDYAELLEGC